MSLSTAKALFVKYTTGSVWVTDGTSSGTFQLPVVPDPGYQSHLLLNTGANEPFLVFGGKLIFVEQEGVGRIADQIYITDGTVAGTSEVTVNNVPTSFYLAIQNGSPNSVIMCCCWTT
jgi:hypothetical protein